MSADSSVWLEQIEIKPGRYFSQIWCVGAAGRNWLAAVWKDPGGPWTIAYRFRHHVDDRAQGSEDERSWYEMQVPSPEPERRILAAVNQIADLTSIQHGGPIHKLVPRTADAGKIVEALKRVKFMQVPT